MAATEVNFDGLVGPTHNYSGLSLGNEASQTSKSRPSNPRLAARQGLAKMLVLSELGLGQGVLAPQERPDLSTLRKLGFSGDDRAVLASAAKHAPRLLAACCSASSMWTANAATVSPSADSSDGKVHFTPANLASKFHRSLEHEVTGRILQATFSDPRYFVHHHALPGGEHFGDEGAANHSRFCREYGEQGIQLFVYGRSAFDRHNRAPARYPARQTQEACQALARLHQLDEHYCVMAQQNPNVVDRGVFHNDVIAVGNRNMLFCHQEAFVNQAAVYQALSNKCGDGFAIIEVPSDQISVDDAVSTYLFNSQLLTLPEGQTMLVVPQECHQQQRVWEYLEQLRSNDLGIDQLHVLDLRQSMANGGGPACLRLRVVLKDAELAAVNPATLMSKALNDRLLSWVDRHYRDRLSEPDLADPQLLLESRTALDELTRILNLGSVYSFQRG